MATRKRTPAAKPATRNSASKPVTSPVWEGGMPRNLGMRLVSLTRKRVVAEMDIKPRHCNRMGNVNGGAIMAFADAVGAAGAVANKPLGWRGGTVESKTNFFAPGFGPVLRAISMPLHIGRTTSVWKTTIRNLDHKLVAVVTQTQIQLPPGGRGD